MPDDKNKKTTDLTPRTILAASLAGALATALVSGVGLTGSLIGGALFPVILLVGREMVLRVVDRVPPPPLPTRQRRPARLPGEPRESGVPVRDDTTETPRSPVRTRRLRRIRWGRVLAAGLAAGAIVVGVFTLPELIIGESLVTDRRTTFFNDAPASTKTTPTTTTEPAPETTTTTGSETDATTDPAPETTTDGVTPTETVPATPPSEPAPRAAPVPEVAPPPEPAPETTTAEPAPAEPAVPPETPTP